MRVRLILLTSVATALLAVGIQVFIWEITWGGIVRLLGYPHYIKDDVTSLISLLLPFCAALFVYRRTQERRIMQAFLALFLSLLLSVILTVTAVFLAHLT